MASKPLQPAEPEESQLRIVLLGRTGVGKSTSGNKILGSDSFKAKLSSVSVTGRCERGTRRFDGQTLVIFDTPGLFHTSKSHREVMKEILECIIWSSPGPHVFLLVLRLRPLSRQDKQTLDTFQKIFQDAANHTIILFTHGDEGEPDAFIHRHKDLKTFIDESCKGYHVFDNEVEDESQVTGLLQKIQNVVIQNDGRFYRNELFEKAGEALEEAMQRTEVKSASDPMKAAKVYVEGLISKCLAALGCEQASILYGGVKRCLNFLIEFVDKHMPPEAQ